jgi:hypothetical protein
MAEAKPPTSLSGCLAAALILAFSSGCGTSSAVVSARDQTIKLDWHEARGRPGNRLIVDVRRFIISNGGWTVVAAIKNDTPGTLTIARRHRRGGTEFGLLVLPSGSADAVNNAGPGNFASRFTPAAPTRLLPGETWQGKFSGPGRLPVGGHVRIEFGSFATSNSERTVAREFRYITDHGLLLR